MVLAGDFNVMPTELDVYKPERWVDDALFRPETRAAFERLLAQGWCDALRSMHPGEKIYTFWDYFRNAYGRDAGLRIDQGARVRARTIDAVGPCGDEIEVVYQPQFSLTDDSLSGAEALARWNHPTLGRIGAGGLFAIAERIEEEDIA